MYGVERRAMRLSSKVLRYPHAAVRRSSLARQQAVSDSYSAKQ